MEPKEVRLQGLFQTYGKTIILPYDQGLEHGPRDFFNARFAEDPLHIIEIAKKGRYNAVALHIGNARRYFKDMYNQVPLVLKVNGKTEIPSDDEPLSPITATIDEARARVVGMAYLFHLRDDVGRVDEIGGHVSTGEDHVKGTSPAPDRLNDRFQGEETEVDRMRYLVKNNYVGAA